MRLSLTDKNKEQQLEVVVESVKDNLVLGTIVSYSFDTALKQKIDKFENLVNSFCIGELLDEAGRQLDGYSWQVKGKDWTVYDFQVFEEKHISFRIKIK